MFHFAKINQAPPLYEILQSSNTEACAINWLRHLETTLILGRGTLASEFMWVIADASARDNWGRHFIYKSKPLACIVTQKTYQMKTILRWTHQRAVLAIWCLPSLSKHCFPSLSFQTFLYLSSILCVVYSHYAT